jgi:hypothetical protein
MAENKINVPSLELFELHPINPETAAHNIALAYIQAALRTEELPLGELYNQDTAITPIVLAYSDAYNFAYNLVTRENKAIDEAE